MFSVSKDEKGRICKAEIICKLIILIFSVSVLSYAGHIISSKVVLALWFFPLLMFLNLASYLPIAENFVHTHSFTLRLKKLSFAWYIVPTAAILSYCIGVINLVSTDYETYWFLLIAWITNISVVVGWSFKKYFHKEEWNLNNLKVFIHDYRWEILGVASLTILAFIIRFVNVGTIPAPFSGDESSIAIEARFNSDLIRNVFKSGIQGHSGLYFLSLVPFHGLFDAQLAQRLPSVLIGTAVIPVFYIFLRQLWGRLVAFGGAAYLSAYHFHNHFSRFGMTVIGDSFIVLLGMFFTWRAIKVGKKSDFILLGLITGMSLYFYVGARMLPFLVVFFLLFASVTRKRYLKNNVVNIFLFFLACMITAAPLGLFWLSHPADFMTAPSGVLIFKTGWLEQQKSWGRDTWQILSSKAKESFGVFGFMRKDGPAYDPPITLVDKFSLVFLITGFLFCILRFWEEKNAVLFAIFFTTIIGGAIMTTNLSTSRLLSTAIPVAAWVALGVVCFCGLFFRGKVLGIMVMATIFLLMAYNLWFYFGEYSKGDYFSDWNTAVAEETAKYMVNYPSNAILFHFGAPSLYAGHPTSKLQFYVNGIQFYDVLEDKRIMPQKPVEKSPRIFVFIQNHRMEELGALKKNCPNGVYKNVTNKKGELIFVTYEFLDNSTCLPD